MNILIIFGLVIIERERISKKCLWIVNVLTIKYQVCMDFFKIFFLKSKKEF